MAPLDVSCPGLDLVALAPRRKTRRSRRIEIAALVSLALHAAVFGAAWLWMRHKAALVLVPPGSPPVIQMVMSPPGGKPHPATAPRTPAPQAAAAQPADHPAHARADAKPENKADKGKDAPPPAAPPEPRQVAAASKPPPEQEQPQIGKTAAATPAQTATATSAEEEVPAPPAPKSEDKLTFDLGQAESDTNAWVTGNDILPPSANVKYHNRKPSYPEAAALRGEQGAVVLLVHVGADGLVQGIDVLRSSGFPLLDRAARDAVRTWHFLPSVRDGKPVPADIPARFVFALE